MEDVSIFFSPEQWRLIESVMKVRAETMDGEAAAAADEIAKTIAAVLA